MQRLPGNPQKEAEIMQNRGVLHKSRGIFQIPGGRIGKSPLFFQKTPRFFAFPSFVCKPKRSVNNTKPNRFKNESVRRYETVIENETIKQLTKVFHDRYEVIF